MDKKAIAERLRELATDDKNRSKAARLRDVIDDVEAALAAGVPRAYVVKELANHGLEMTLATFETTLTRIRRKRENQLRNMTKQSGGRSIMKSESPGQVSHNPADLDKIIGSNPDLPALAKLAKKGPK